MRGQAGSLASHYLLSGPTFSPSSPWHPGRSSLLPANISLLSSLIEKVILVRIEFREEHLRQTEEQRDNSIFYNCRFDCSRWYFNPDSNVEIFTTKPEIFPQTAPRLARVLLGRSPG